MVTDPQRVLTNLQRGLEPVTWAAIALLAVLALMGSFMVSYTRARAEGLGLDCRVGWFERPERMVLLILIGVRGSRIGDPGWPADPRDVVVRHRRSSAWRTSGATHPRERVPRFHGGMKSMGNKVRVAIIGVGNCASSFVQGLHYYRNAKETRSHARASCT